MNDQPMIKTSPLKQMEQFGQSPWLDFIERKFLSDGSLQKLLDEDGLKGMTSNPTIFEKAMGGGTNYDAGFKTLAGEGRPRCAQDIYEALAIEDIQHAADMLRPVYDATNRVDGYVSLEVSPYLALRTEETVAEARRLWKAVGRDNLMVKVPGTDAGTPAIRTLISEGININVTLLFAQKAYEDVADAFIEGLTEFHAKGGDVSRVASVASFFVSRIDAAIDKKIDARLAADDAPDVRRPQAHPRQGRHRQRQARLPALSRPAEVTEVGSRSPTPAPCRSACSGPAPEPRTRPTATCSTSRS